MTVDAHTSGGVSWWPYPDPRVGGGAWATATVVRINMTQPSFLRTLFGDAQTRSRLISLYGGLIAFNVVA